jgi:TolA-binding protein
MRFHLLGFILAASVAMPALAQQEARIDRRVDRLEQEMRAVQRRVFPGATAPYVGPEISEQTQAPETDGVPASGAVADLSARVDALESQLRDLTGQIEQNANRLRLVEDSLKSFRESTGSRLETLEGAQAAPPEPEPSRPSASATTPRPQPAAATPTPSSPAAAADAEAAYNAGYRLWEQKRYAEAQQALEQVGKRWPDSRWASWANNLAGRASLDAGKPATAAKILLANYQGNPRGERAADSLYFLGQALVALKKPADACKAYDELQDVYGDSVRDYLKQRLPKARADAKCG